MQIIQWFPKPNDRRRIIISRFARFTELSTQPTMQQTSLPAQAPSVRVCWPLLYNLYSKRSLVSLLTNIYRNTFHIVCTNQKSSSPNTVLVFMIGSLHASTKHPFRNYLFGAIYTLFLIFMDSPRADHSLPRRVVHSSLWASSSDTKSCPTRRHIVSI